MKERLFRWNHALWVVLLAIQFLPNRLEKDAHGSAALGVVIGIEVLALLLSIKKLSKKDRQLFVDIFCVIEVFFIAWTLLTAKTGLADANYFPAPGQVFAEMASDWSKILINIGSSLGVIAQGFILGIVLAIPLGLFFGSSSRYSKTAEYIAVFLAAIPPIVYIPYGIRLLPSFRAAAVFVIFLATFWPTLVSAMSGAGSVERRILDSARALGVAKPTMLFRIVLPASLPSVFNGMGIGLTISFILLTSAEMIGMGKGMGYYVKDASDFGNFTKVVVGIVVIGVVITAITVLFGKLKAHLLRWKR